MRPSQYNDYKRKCLKKWDQGDYHLKSIAVKNVFNWNDAKITFHHPITLITGKNGVGKTTAISAIKHALKKEDPNAPEIGFFSSLKDFEVQLENSKGELIQIFDNYESYGFDLPPITDLTFNSRLYSFFNEYTTQSMLYYQETLQQFDTITLSSNLHKIMEEILEKSIQLAEKITDEDETQIEYYKITISDSLWYDSYTMGSGEFFINQFLWKLNEIPKNSIVIIEELENYLHSGAQKKIVELIHEYSVKKNIQFILTTHSPTLIDHSADESIILLKILDSNIIPIENCPKWLAKDVLGKTIENKICILFEDQEAKLLFTTIISQNNPDMLNQLKLIDQMDGHSQVTKIVGAIHKIREIKCIGILDGDVPTEENDHLLKLPTNNPPEKLVISFEDQFFKEVAISINKEEEQVKEAFTQIKSIRDHHEWLPRLSISLGENEEYLWVTLTKIWYKYNEDIGKEFFSKFEKIYVSNMP
jgi:predicted ATPase